MKKIIRISIIILVLFIFTPFVFANNINTEDLDFNHMEFSETENPVTYKYFNDYADMLRSKINYKKYKRFWLMSYRYKLHSDGTISELSPTPLNTPYEGTKKNEYFESILLDNLPPKFPENMEIGDVYIQLYASRNCEKTETKIYYTKGYYFTIFYGNEVIIFLNEE
jgi:hypothetical protein